ncbi:MAG: hypothetical protein K8R79_07190 [Calditrichales bacterium]|nr:hypothetical protein [Calditrichales bacterium]
MYPTKISDYFLNFCFRHSGGNVFDLFEFLRYLIDKGQLTKSEKQWLEPLNHETLEMPRSLEKRINTRMKKLNKTAGSIMAGASVLEDSLDLEIWLALFDFKEDQFFDAVDELVKNQIIIKTDGSYQFSHAKLKDAVYNNLTAKQKMIYHQRAAEFYESKLPDDENNIIPIIARHYAASQVEKQAIDYSLKAAEIAEKNEAEWIAFNDYRTAAQFLQKNKSYPNRDQILLEIYEKAAQFSSAAWIDASTSLGWLQKAIDHYSKENDLEKVFNLSLSYIVSGSITSNYDLARQKISEIIKSCKVEEDTLQWAVLFGAGVCLVDWYQGFQTDCFDHAQSAINIFEKELQNLPEGMWPAYSWALFWRDKARAYMGKPIVIENVEKIRQLMEQGKSDLTIYWHTLTAVGARAAFTGRYKDLLEWKQLASKLSQKMGKVYWFECWISHSYLYAALDRGEFSQIENHIKRVQASYDPY